MLAGQVGQRHQGVIVLNRKRLTPPSPAHQQQPQQPDQPAQPPTCKCRDGLRRTQASQFDRPNITSAIEAGTWKAVLVDTVDRRIEAHVEVDIADGRTVRQWQPGLGWAAVEG